MPFCTQCGNKVADADIFCAGCGKRQTSPPSGAAGAAPPPPWPPPEPPADPLAGLSPHTAAILCYVPYIGWVAAVIVLIARRFKADRIARFHAFQALYLFAVSLVVDWSANPSVLAIPRHVGYVLKGVLLAVSIFMMVKASHDEAYVLPIIGELAQKSAAEQ